MIKKKFMENTQENILSERIYLMDECLKIRTEKGRKAVCFEWLVDATDEQMKIFLNHPYIKKLRRAA